SFSLFFFFNSTANTEIYTLSLHDALPILQRRDQRLEFAQTLADRRRPAHAERPGHRRSDRHRPPGHPFARRESSLLAGTKRRPQDRKSTRLNSSHVAISYAVFCLKKKKQK